MSASTPLWEVAIGHQMSDMFISDEDVEELRSERTIKQTKISLEELQKLTIDENLSPVERLIYILREGQEVQKINALSNVVKVLQVEQTASQVIITSLKDELDSSSNEIVLACLLCMSKILQKHLISSELFESLFLSNILESFKKNKDKEIVKACIDVLQNSLEILPKHVFDTQLLDFILLNSSLTSHILTREACCWIIGFLSKYTPEMIYVNKVIPIMKLLCQDIELDVRSCMCQQLQIIFDNVKTEILVGIVLPELYLLFQDEETIVRQAALSALCNVLHKMEQDELIDSLLLSLIIKFYKRALTKKISEELSMAARYIGELYHTLSIYFSQNEKSLLMECYQQLCCHGYDENNNSMKFQDVEYTSTSPMDKSSECRFWCAFNLPAMLLSISPSCFKSLLLPSFMLLSRDSNAIVRRCIASSLHEVAKVLPQDEMHLIQPVFINFLQDRDFEVLDALMKGLSIVLECLTNSAQYQDNLSDLFPLLLSCESYLSSSLHWRVHVKLLKEFSILHKYLTSELIYLKLVPLLFDILNSNKVLPVQHAAGRLLLEYLKFNRVVDERNIMHARVIKELAHSESCRKRLLFLDICQFVPDFFSKSFFKEYFYDFVMAMAADPIVNVRIKFCKTLVLLKSQINLPYDRLLLQILEQSVRRIMALENDRDVSNTIRKVIVELDGMSIINSDDPTAPDYLLDQEKEKNEENIFSESQRVESDSPRKTSIDKNDSSKRSRNNSLIMTKDTVNHKKPLAKSSKTNTTISSKQSASSRSKDSCLRKSSSTSGSSSVSTRLSTAKKSSSHSTTSTKKHGK